MVRETIEIVECLRTDYSHSTEDPVNLLTILA